MSDHEYYKGVERIKQTIYSEIDKDIVVASEHDVEGAKKHLQPLIDKLRRLEVVQKKEMKLEPEIAAIIRDEIRLEEHLIALIIAFIKETQEDKQEKLLDQMLQVLASLQELSKKEATIIK